MDDSYLDKLFSDVTALYRLDQGGGASAGGKEDLGSLPAGAKALIIGLAVVWLCIAVYVIRETVKKKKIAKND